MVRLFTALAPPEGVRDALALCRGGLPDARWIAYSDYHVTLSFIGDVDEATAEAIAAALSRIDHPPLDVNCTVYGAFTGRGGHSVHLACGVSEPLLSLHHASNAAIFEAGVTPEVRKYAPHITIARLPRRAEDSIAPWLDGRAYLGPRTFRAESFGLFTAKPGGGGGPYHEAVRFPLTG